MSLNCLTCSQLLQRIDSFGKLFAEREIYKHVDESWSEKMSSKCEIPKVGRLAKIKADHRRNYSTGDVPYPHTTSESGPKLLRSSGMRRNWSFEDVTQKQDQSLTFH